MPDFDFQTMSREAREKAREYQKPVWLYRVGPDCYGFRFAPLPETEHGELVAIYYPPRYSRLIRVCAWCRVLLGTSEPTEPGKTGQTHSICPACLTGMKGTP